MCIRDSAYTTNYSEIYGYGSTWAATGEDSEYHYTVNELNSLLTASYTWNINCLLYTSYESYLPDGYILPTNQ